MTANTTSAIDSRAFEEFQAAERDMLRARDALTRLEAEKADLLNGDDGPIDASQAVAAVNALEDRIAGARIALAKAANAYIIRGDHIHRLRVRGRGRAQAELEADLQRLEQDAAAMMAKVREHEAAIFTLRRSLTSVESQRRGLVGKIGALEPSLAKALTVTVLDADPLRPPPELLIRPGEWRWLIDQARAHSLPTVQFVLDETGGRVTGTPFTREEHR